MAKKRKTRKQLLKEPDEFISFSSKILDFVVKHKITICYALGVTVLLVFIGSGIRYFSNQAENKAFTLLELAIQKYDSAAKDNSPEKAFQNVEQDFDFIVKKYSKKNGGKLATIIYANISNNAGHYEKAISLYNKAMSAFNDHPEIKSIILSGTAYNYEATKNYKEAVDCFERIINQPDNIMKDEAFFNLGRIYELMGENEKSTAAFKKIISDYTDSIYIELAKEKAKI